MQKAVRSGMIIVGILALIGVMGMIDRGWFDWLGLGALACLVVPTVIAIRSE